MSPPTAVPEPATLERLKQLQAERTQVLDDLRRAVPLVDVLFELTVFRGMSPREAAEVVGITRQGVEYRTARLRERYSVTNVWADRFTTEAPRPLADATDAELYDMLRSGDPDHAKRRRDLGARSRQLLADMQDVLGQLEDAGLDDDEIAEHVGVHPTTVKRWRTKDVEA